ncbi:MAG: NifB/NifX family molybdenum-iron cluster-binding protein [Rhodospirillales bacterium]|nr:NifB/NifX family molybdenum-iron cluster-binding protein [Rhodospirillales bacterium]
MTLIAITAESASLDAPVDPRFGRAAGFALVDSEAEGMTWLSNAEAATMPGGAGIQAAETIAKAGARVLLTGRVGPKAQSALTAAGIAVEEDRAGMTVREAVSRYKAKQGVKEPRP